MWLVMVVTALMTCRGICADITSDDIRSSVKKTADGSGAVTISFTYRGSPSSYTFVTGTDGLVLN